MMEDEKIQAIIERVMREVGASREPAGQAQPAPPPPERRASARQQPPAAPRLPEEMVSTPAWMRP